MAQKTLITVTPVSTLSRSPRAPSYDLQFAEERLSKLYNKDRKSATPRDVAVKHLGYTGVTGASSRMLATLIQFGLIESVGQSQIRVSLAGEAILVPHSNEEKVKSLREALFRPAIFATLFEQYGMDLPSEETLIARLVRDYKFTRVAAQECIRVLQESLHYVKALAPDWDNEGTRTIELESQQVESESLQGVERDGEQNKTLRPIASHVDAVSASSVEGKNHFDEMIVGKLSDRTTITVGVNGPLGAKEQLRLQMWLQKVLTPWTSLKAVKDQFNEEEESEIGG